MDPNGAIPVRIVDKNLVTGAIPLRISTASGALPVAPSTASGAIAAYLTDSYTSIAVRDVTGTLAGGGGGGETFIYLTEGGDRILNEDGGYALMENAA